VPGHINYAIRSVLCQCVSLAAKRGMIISTNTPQLAAGMRGFINQDTEYNLLFKNEIESLREPLKGYYSAVIGLALPMGVTPRKIYDLAVAGCKILVNEGLFEFSLRFRAPIFDIKKK